MLSGFRESSAGLIYVAFIIGHRAPGILAPTWRCSCLDRAKWCLWHGRWTGCRRKLASLCRWTKRKPMRDVAGIGRLQRHVSDLLGYLERNQGALVPYAARRRRGEPISTAFVESAVNEIVAKRMNKAQQMRWNRATVQPFLDVRTAVLNGTLEDAFRQRYPDFRPANDGHKAIETAACSPHDFACSPPERHPDRAVVAGRGPCRPEEQDRPPLGPTGNSAPRPARPENELSLHLRGDLPATGQGRSPGHAEVRHASDEPALGGSRASRGSWSPWGYADGPGRMALHQGPCRARQSHAGAAASPSARIEPG